MLELFVLSFLNLTQLQEMVYMYRWIPPARWKHFWILGVHHSVVNLSSSGIPNFHLLRANRLLKKYRFDFSAWTSKSMKEKIFLTVSPAIFFFVSNIGFTYNLNLAASEEMLLHKHASETIKRLQWNPFNKKYLAWVKYALNMLRLELESKTQLKLEYYSTDKIASLYGLYYLIGSDK